MNENWPNKLLSNFSCSSCKFQFGIKDLTLKGSKCPMLLQCGHSLCNYCLHQNVKGTNNITCQLCGFVSSWNSSEAPNKSFSFNLYILGSLVCQHSRSEKDKKLAFLAKNNGDFNYAVLGQSQNNSEPEQKGGACEECSLKASWHCENCRSNFCEICWSRVHGFAKSLTKHYRTSISEVSKIGLKKCAEHETQTLEFFCRECDKAICSHCVILQHQGEGHHSITLKEKNLEMYNKVKVAAENADKMNKRMKQTLEGIKLKQAAPGSRGSKSYADLESQISRNFSRIHGILQLEEERLIKQLHEKSNERENSFKSFQTQLEEQMEAVDYLLRECDFAVKTPNNTDLTDLHRQLTEVQNLPCYLISLKTENKEAKLEFDEKLIDSVRNYCKMDLPSDERFELRSSSNLPEDYPIEDVSNLDQPVEEERESNTSSIPDLESLSNRSSRDLQKNDVTDVMKNSSGSSKEPKVFLERKTYCVRISFIKNPGEFYVTLNSQRAKQRAIDKRASMLARLVATIPQTYEKGDIFLVKYNVDKKWYRGRIVEVIPSKRTGGEDSVVVYYLDYGNFETVPISRLRPIPTDLLEEFPLAIKCKLFDCVPQSGEWCPESTKTMEKILKNHAATMFVMKVHSDCLEVDLSVIYPEGQIGRDIVSVRDALLFLGFSSFVHGFKVPRNATAFKYLEQCLPAAGERFDVTVTHVNSPSDFYVQRTRIDANYLYKLATDLQTYYEENCEKGMIYNPTVDMPCAALFSADKRWYRAKIVEVPGKKMVTVFYVDYGNRETIQWTEIRKLKENFAKCPPLAFNCALAGVAPIDGAPWTINAKSYLKKNILMREGHVIVQGKSRCKQRLKVLLFKKGSEKDVCLNTSFVCMGLGIQPCDSECLWMLNNVEKDEGNEDKRTKETKELLKEQKSESGSEKSQAVSERKNGDKGNNVFKDRKKNKPSAKELRELHESEKQNQPEGQLSSGPTQNEIDQYKNIFKVKVDILSAESPSCIYVTFPTLMAEFENLQVSLNEFYENSNPDSDAKWTVGSICAVFDSTKRNWYRASIQSLLPNDRVEVFLKDIAKVTSESLSSLRTLDPSFKKYSSCAIRCHLADVKPPGDEWPSISTEFLTEELENHSEVYMTKRGQTENGSLPIELWVQKVVTRGALEPTKKEWITLNRLIVSQGLAVPLKLDTWSAVEVSTEDEEYSDEEKSLDNTMESIEPLSGKTDLTDASNEMSEAFVPSLSSSWIPSLPIEKSRFVGMPTYVDYNAYVYMYDVEQDEENLKKIREALRNEYRNSKPNPEDHFWIPGQMCIARYHVDNFWYRGVVVQEHEDMTYDILFVDYGNIETCKVEDLRKKIKMHDIPILTHKFQLHGIETTSKNGEWPESSIDLLHYNIVDKECEVNILKHPRNPDDPYVVTMKLIQKDIDVATFLIEENLAVLDVSETDVVPSDNAFFPLPSEFIDDSAVLRYSPLIIPENCNEFSIEVTNVISETEFFANITLDESLPPCLKNVLNEFTSLQEELTKEAHLQPLVENLIEDNPCCCLDFANNKWCRGEIESFVKNRNSVCVFFVDYGTKELLHKNFIRDCKDSWVDLPKMAVKFKLGGVGRCNNVSESAFKKELTNCLTGTSLFAEIIHREKDFTEVRLLTSKNGALAYQKMVDEGLMKFF